MRQRAIDLDFLTSLIKAREIKFDDDLGQLSFDDNFLPESTKEELEYWQKAIQALDILHITEDINIKSMTDTDFWTLDILINAFVENQLVSNIKKDFSPNFSMSVGDLKIALIHTPEVGIENTSRIYDFFDNRFTYGFRLDKEVAAPQHFVPPCATFDKSAWSEISNINYEDVLPSFKRIFKASKDSYIFEVANNTLLSILSAYDEIKKQTLLTLAQQLSERLLENCTEGVLHRHIRTINYLQAIKRSRALDKGERKQLHEIAGDLATEERMRIGAHVLLDNYEAAELNFEKLDSTEQGNFCEWPIYYFWDRQIDSEVKQ